MLSNATEVRYITITIVILELLYLNVRNSSVFYGIKIEREEQTSVSDAFAAYKEKAFKVFLLGIIKDICYAVGFCLVYVGYIAVLYWFRFSAHVLKDEDCGPFQAMKKSMKLLKGHYGELFKLDISNLGWRVLSVVTFGLAGIYVKPYLQVVYAEFYEYLKAQNALYEN
jgi:uncharacterized membrane protein